MKRRALLAGTSSALSVSAVGCFDNSRTNDGPQTNDGAQNNTETPSVTELSSEYSGACESIGQPLSERLGDPPRTSSCHDGATPSFTIENEREADVTVTVSIQSLTETYTLESGERIVEWHAFEASDDLKGTVEVNGKEKQIGWPDRSCYRHGVAITATDIETGYIEPMRGPGDVQHDCYAGDNALLTVVSRGVERSITVTIGNVCSGEEVIEEFDLPADGIERTNELLTSGGIYLLTAAVDDGESKSYTFHDNCLGVEISVDEGGELRFIEHNID